MQARKGAVRNMQICEIWFAAKPPLRVQQRERLPERLIGSVSRSESEGIVLVDDGVLVAVIFGGRHDADLSVNLEENDRDHQGPGKIECVVLCKVEIRHVRLHLVAGPIPARWRPFEPGLAAVTSAAQPERSQLAREPLAG